jgi:endonuclease III
MLFDVSLREKALNALEVEQDHYGEFDVYAHHNGDPLPQLIKTMLSHRTTRADEQQAYTAMWRMFRSWAAIQEADTDALTEALAPARYPDVKAKNIQRTLRRIHRREGAYTLEFLRDTPTAEALTWLRSLPGVGVKTASLVLLFCFKRPVIPVDTHVHRVTRRLGIIGENVSADKAHQRLLDILPNDPQTLYNFHRATMKHGQRVCHHRNPACADCPLQHLCDTYHYRQETL